MSRTIKILNYTTCTATVRYNGGNYGDNPSTTVSIPPGSYSIVTVNNTVISMGPTVRNGTACNSAAGDGAIYQFSSDAYLMLGYWVQPTSGNDSYVYGYTSSGYLNITDVVSNKYNSSIAVGIVQQPSDFTVPSLPNTTGTLYTPTNDTSNCPSCDPCLPGASCPECSPCDPCDSCPIYSPCPPCNSPTQTSSSGGMSTTTKVIIGIVVTLIILMIIIGGIAAYHKSKKSDDTTATPDTTATAAPTA